MGDITFGGLSTGLPTDDIVTKLMAIEHQPIDRLETQKDSEKTRLEAFKQLDTRLEDLRSAVGAMNITSEVRSSSIDLSSKDAFTASSNGAATGSYDVAVVQLAQVQKTISGGISSQTDAIGTGTFTVGDATITVDATNNSLIGIADSINALSESSGVHATIINDGRDANAYHLVLTGQDATTSFAASAALKDSGGDAIDFTLLNTRTAQQAKAIVDGVPVVSDSNTLSGVVAGVTLHLNNVSTITSADGVDPPVYDTTLMTVAPDTAPLKEKVNTFVSSYNAVMDWISAGYVEFGATAPTDKQVAAGADEVLSSNLRGDSTVNSVKRQLQNILSSSVATSGPYKVLSQLGISTQKDGSINFNETTLDKALTTDFNGVVDLLAGEGDVPGVMKGFNSRLLALTGASSGMYAEKHDNYASAVKRLDDQIARMEPLVAQKEKTLRARFSNMELLVGNLNTQSDYLTQQFDMLSKMTTGN